MNNNGCDSLITGLRITMLRFMICLCEMCVVVRVGTIFQQIP